MSEQNKFILTHWNIKKLSSEIILHIYTPYTPQLPSSVSIMPGYKRGFKLKEGTSNSAVSSQGSHAPQGKLVIDERVPLVEWNHHATITQSSSIAENTEDTRKKICSCNTSFITWGPLGLKPGLRSPSEASGLQRHCTTLIITHWASVSEGSHFGFAVPVAMQTIFLGRTVE
jgi:hypothetical protein